MKNDDDDDDDIARRPGTIAAKPAQANTTEENGVLEEVNLIISTVREMHPGLVVDPNEVYELIETESANVDRKNIVIERLIAKRPKDGNEENGPDKYAELVNDVDVVRKFVPNKSREEILAYLEAFHENPNRIRIVIGELLEMNGMAPFPLTGIVENVSTSGEKKNESSTSMDAVNSILELFPDADPEFLQNFIERNKNDVNYINATVNGWMENRSYPKLTEVKKEATKRKFLESTFSVEEFLEMFPDPENYFKNDKRVVTASYKLHVQIYVENQFPYAYKTDLWAVMKKHQYLLTPIMKELNAQWNVSSTDEPLVKKRKENVRKKKQMSAKKAMPKAIDEPFYKEKLFIEMEEKIKQFKKDKEIERERKIEMVKRMGELMECNCCFEDELLIEDMLHCSDGHLFCKTCIRRQAEVNIGQGAYEFPCLDPYCENKFPLIMLQNVLSPNMFSNLVRKMQEEEIRRADIPDLESCPHCSFCAIMPDDSVKIFRCLNPACLKVTCRSCKEPNHLPLRCDEIEQKSEVRFRTFIENQMTDAMLRTCPSCKRRIIKEYGCNKMTCSCGQFFCYVCREPIADYHHFETGKCPQYSNDAELHRLEVQEGAKKAIKDYREAHPEVELKNDPTKTSFVELHRNHQQYAQGAMPVVNEHGQIVFQRPRQQPPQLAAPRPPQGRPAQRPSQGRPAQRPPP